MIAAGRTLLAAVGRWNRVVTVTPLSPRMVENPHFPGQFTPSWDDPIEGDAVGGILQPVSEETATRMGLASRSDVKTLYCDATTLDPQGRVRISGSHWLVLEVRHWASHTEAIIERLADGS